MKCQGKYKWNLSELLLKAVKKLYLRIICSPLKTLLVDISELILYNIITTETEFLWRCSRNPCNKQNSVFCTNNILLLLFYKNMHSTFWARVFFQLRRPHPVNYLKFWAYMYSMNFFSHTLLARNCLNYVVFDSFGNLSYFCLSEVLVRVFLEVLSKVKQIDILAKKILNIHFFFFYWLIFQMTDWLISRVPSFVCLNITDSLVKTTNSLIFFF